MGRVSVIIPTFNCSRYICGAIQSVLNQTYNDYEIIVMDDGSTDDTRKVLEQFKNKMTYFYQKNKGVSSARNEAIKLSQGDLIAFLDCDDRWLPSKLATQVKYMIDNPDVAMIHSNVAFVTDNYVMRERLDHIVKRHKGFDIFEELYLGNFINTSTVLLRRNCLETVGLFDEELPLAQDYDLWLRIAAKFNVGYQDIVTAHYRFHDANISKNTTAQTTEVLHILRKIEEIHPEMVKKIDRRKRENRHFRLNYSLAYAYFSRYKLAMARHYFLNAWKYKKNYLSLYGYLLSTFLSKQVIGLLQNVKRRLTHSQKKSSTKK